jgi:hypothetical protein
MLAMNGIEFNARRKERIARVRRTHAYKSVSFIDKIAGVVLTSPAINLFRTRTTHVDSAQDITATSVTAAASSAPLVLIPVVLQLLLRSFRCGSLARG